MDTTDAACGSMHGGLFDPNGSKSFQSKSDCAGARASCVDNAPVTNTTLFHWGTDEFHLSSNVTLPGSPFGTHTDPFDGDGGSGGGRLPPGILGLSSNSTFLNSLREANVIGSNVYSFYWGSTGATKDTQADGSLVLGGYDAAKTAGQPLFNFSTVSNIGCNPGVPGVVIQDLKLVFPNGTKASIFGDASTALNACLDFSSTSLLSIPYKYYQAFEDISGQYTAGRSFGVDFYNLQIDNTSTTTFVFSPW